MPATYDSIASTTLGSAQTNITFSSISGTYTDLKLVIAAFQGSGNNISLRFNGDSGSNYSRTILQGDGASASSSRSSSSTNISLNSQGLSATIPSFYEIDLFSYSGSTNKTILVRTNEDRNGSGTVRATVALWRNTGAITSIEITANITGAGDTLGANTIATLYGILKA